MFTKVTSSRSEELTARWHDQTLEIEALEFNEAKGQCLFFILEQSQSLSAAKLLLQERRLQRSKVIVKNVTAVRISGAKGEIELYIEEVITCPNLLCIKCING